MGKKKTFKLYFTNLCDPEMKILSYLNLWDKLKIKFNIIKKGGEKNLIRGI